MVALVKTKLSKIIGLKKEAFNDLIKQKGIAVVRPRLIPTYKVGDENALTSVLLSSLRLIKEFRQAFLSDAKMMRGGKIYLYTEVKFAEFPESRIDGLILIVKNGVIRDAAILEVKNARDTLDKPQLERYQQIARSLAIPTFITVSNEFVTDPSQSPVPLKNLKKVDMYHFSWTYLLTIAHVLLYKNTTNIADEDQVEIMEEVVRYLESDKSGVLGYTRMSAEWTQIAEKINKGGAIKRSDEDVALAVRSWQEQERDMALYLSRSIGFIVECGESKYKGKLTERLDDDCKQLASDKMLDTSFRIKGAVSDIKTRLLFEKRTVEMEVALRVPDNKTQKGQIGWIKRQIECCMKRQESLVKSLSRSVFIEPCLKNVRSHERIPLSNFERVYEYAVGGELREFKIVYVVDLGAKFASPTKFVGQSEAMLKAFYNAFVQHLVKWEPSAPKVSPKLANTEEESFIESVNRGEMDYISQPDTEAANSPTPLTTLFPNGYSRSA